MQTKLAVTILCNNNRKSVKNSNIKTVLALSGKIEKNKMNTYISIYLYTHLPFTLCLEK